MALVAAGEFDLRNGELIPDPGLGFHEGRTVSMLQLSALVQLPTVRQPRHLSLWSSRPLDSIVRVHQLVEIIVIS